MFAAYLLIYYSDTLGTNKINYLKNPYLSHTQCRGGISLTS